MERYNLYWKNRRIGYITYDNHKDLFYAKLNDSSHGYPRVLFGIFKPKSEANDTDVRRYLEYATLPPTREGLDDTLRRLGVRGYNRWEIFKAYKGRNANDHTSIKPEGYE